MVYTNTFQRFNSLSPHDALKHRFTSLKTYFFPTTKGFRTKISMKLVYQYVVIFFNFQTTSGHLHPPQVENCGSNSRLVVDEEDYGKFRIERANTPSHHQVKIWPSIQLTKCERLIQLTWGYPDRLQTLANQ